MSFIHLERNDFQGGSILAIASLQECVEGEEAPPGIVTTFLGFPAFYQGEIHYFAGLDRRFIPSSRLPYSSNRFGTIIDGTANSSHNIPFYQEMIRILKPGGRLETITSPTYFDYLNQAGLEIQEMYGSCLRSNPRELIAGTFIKPPTYQN